jgi:hypothetical protein
MGVEAGIGVVPEREFVRGATGLVKSILSPLRGWVFLCRLTHGLRRGLQSFAALAAAYLRG